MYVFSGKNSEKTRSEHLYNIVEIVKIAMKVENEALIKFGLTFADVYKENHFIAIIQESLRKKGYATVLEYSSEGKKGRKRAKFRNDMMIYYGDDWNEEITLELKMLWATDRHDKIKSYINDIKKLNYIDDVFSYIAIGLYLYNNNYEENNRFVDTESLLEKEYSMLIKNLNTKHFIKNFEGDGGFDFPIHPPDDGTDEDPWAPSENWDRCRVIYCGKAYV